MLLAGFGTRGDVQPLIALARGLLARGHDATVAGPPDFEAWATSLGVRYAPVGERIGEFLGRVSDAKGDLLPRRALAAMPGWLRSHYAPLTPLVAVADVVLAASMTVAPLDLAEALGKRVHFVAYCPQAIPSGEHPMAFVSSHRLPGWLNRLSFWLGAKGHDWNVRRHLDEERAALGLKPAPATWDHLLFRNLVLASEEAMAPLPADLPPRHRVLQPGAWFLEGGEPLPGALERFLELGAPPVYVGFGSMPDTAPAETAAWVRAAAERAGARVVLQSTTAGSDERLCCVGAVDHHALFARCAGVIHHGGAGTTATAARAGVPQAVAPHVTDQYFWADRLERLGVAGPRLAIRRRDVAGLADTLRVLETDETLRERARALARRIPGDGVARMIAALEGEAASGG